MTLLSREAILAVDDRTYTEVPVPEWSPPGGDVARARLRSITGAERDAYEQGLMEQRGKDRRMNLRNARAKLIVLCLVDEHGRRLFADGDVNALGRKNAKPLDRLFDACRALCGLSDDDVDKLVEDFDDAQSDDSISA